MNKKRYIILAFIIIIIFCADSIYSINNYADPIIADDNPINPEIQEAINLDDLYAFDYDYKDGYVKYCTERAIFYAEKDYLTEDELRNYAKKVDDGIANIEEYLKMKLDSENFINSRIFVNIEGSPDNSELNDENIDIDHTAVIAVDNVKENHSSYIHKLTHTIAWKSGTTWTMEGLAVYLNDKLESESTSPNYGCNIDNLSLKYYNDGSSESLSALELVGKNGTPNYLNDIVELRFHVFSASFVKYIETSIGTIDFMKIYASTNTSETILNITGKDMDNWKFEWLNSLL